MTQLLDSSKYGVLLRMDVRQGADDFENLLHGWFSIVQAVSFGGLLRSHTTQSMRSNLTWCVDSAVGNLEPSQRQFHEAGLGVV